MADIEDALQAIGVDPSTLDPAFLDALRAADPTSDQPADDPLAAGYAQHVELMSREPSEAMKAAKQEADQRFARDVADHLHGGTWSAAPTASDGGPPDA